MQITSIAHIKLTVTDLEISKKFYSLLPGFKVVAEYEGFVMFNAGSFYLGLTDHNKKLNAKKFDEFSVGLDHFAFGVDSLESLNEAVKLLNDNNIQHSGIQNLSKGTHIVVFRDPDNIQLEFSYKPTRQKSQSK